MEPVEWLGSLYAEIIMSVAEIECNAFLNQLGFLKPGGGVELVIRYITLKRCEKIIKTTSQTFLMSATSCSNIQRHPSGIFALTMRFQTAKAINCVTYSALW